MASLSRVATVPNQLIRCDGFILGSPTYAAGICGPFKSFMDTTGRLWRQQLLDC
jgi:NAD(P)H dehydrogenase (quinone)